MSSILSEHKTFLKDGGAFENSKGFIKISGDDRVDFLHRITSQDIKNLISGNGLGGALLDPGGLILSLFDIYNCGHFFFLVLDKSEVSRCIENLERLHFAEDLEISDVSKDFTFLSLQGPPFIKTELKKVFGKVPVVKGEIIGVEEAFIAFSPDFNDKATGFHLFVKEGNYSEVRSKMARSGFKTLSLELWKLMRAESGRFSFGTDITDKNMVLEAALEGSVARNKGCYPGQEVVERVFTYGTISKKLMGLKLTGEVPLSQGRIKLLGNGEDAGYLTSQYKIPWSGQIFGFGIIRKPKYEVGQKLNVENSSVQVEVSALPHSFEIKKELKA